MAHMRWLMATCLLTSTVCPRTCNDLLLLVTDSELVTISHRLLTTICGLLSSIISIIVCRCCPDAKGLLPASHIRLLRWLRVATAIHVGTEVCAVRTSSQISGGSWRRIRHSS